MKNALSRPAAFRRKSCLGNYGISPAAGFRYGLLDITFDQIQKLIGVKRLDEIIGGHKILGFQN